MPQKRPYGRERLAGWRKAGVLNTISICTLTLTTIALLGASAVKVEPGRSFLNTLVLFEGNCQTASRLNTALHVLVNAIGTLVLASSNFFMQVLSAPTRREVDQAHARRKPLEIGVQSVANLFHVPASKVVLYLLLALSSVPLHLFSNSCLTESKSSTDFLLAVAAGSFLDDGNKVWPGVDTDGSQLRNQQASSVVQRELDRVAEVASTWDRLGITRCLEIYDDTKKAMTTRRHVVMVVANEGESDTAGWPNNGSTNSLWLAKDFRRTELWIGEQENERVINEESYRRIDADERFSKVLDIDPSTGLIQIPVGLLDYQDAPTALQAKYCLSEPFVVPCQVQLHNSLLLVVCVCCLLKSVGCTAALLRLRNNEPLLTPGDAIESFMTNPDPTTANMCWLSGDRARGHYWEPGRKQWQDPPRKTGSAVPRLIWTLSYIFFLVLLTTATVLLYHAQTSQSLTMSKFGPDPANQQDVNIDVDGSLVRAAVVANLPQLLFSIAYLAYNGLFTRMLNEREWSSYSVSFQPLRVSRKKGFQKSSYRLQLPFRWSIPLISTSGVLHWLISNCIFVTLYKSYDSLPPYVSSSSTSGTGGLGFSTKAILITVAISFSLCLVPIILGFTKLPGRMVLAMNSSTVISAACHCIPVESNIQIGDEDAVLLSLRSDVVKKPWLEERLPGDRSAELLQEMSMQKLKWGVIKLTRQQNSSARPDHLSFGTMDQDIEPPVVGLWYSGTWRFKLKQR